MDRVKAGGYSHLIEAAYSLIPATLHPLIQPHFLCGTDPLFAGLHAYPDIEDGRSYRDTAHVAYPHNQTIVAKAHRHTTVVLPQPAKRLNPIILVHELGHVLHESLGWEHEADAVTRYGETNRYEAFAEAFTSWRVPGYAERPDAHTIAVFESLLSDATLTASARHR